MSPVRTTDFVFDLVSFVSATLIDPAFSIRADGRKIGQNNYHSPVCPPYRPNTPPSTQLVLATGSADATVRVWDVGERVVPHADEWTRLKRQFLLPSGNSNKLERPGVQDGNSHQHQDRPSAAPDIASLENALVHRKDDGDAKLSVPREQNDQFASAEHATNTPMEEVVASKEKARSALRSLRPEILRQADVRPTWRVGRVTAVIDLTGTVNPLTRHHRWATTAKKSEPLIEVKDRSQAYF